MKNSILMQKISSYLLTVKQWYLETPERSLDEAYKAALLIKSIEDKHFNSKKITPESNSCRGSVMSYFQSELKKHLKTIRLRLAEFEVSRSFVNTYNQTITAVVQHTTINSAQSSRAIQTRNNPELILEKLRFIDEVLTKYNLDEQASISLIVNTQNIHNDPKTFVVNQKIEPINNLEDKKTSSTVEMNVLPRSLLNTINRIQSKHNPKAEQQIIKDFRLSQRRSTIAIKFIFMLILTPLLTYHLSKNILVEPIVNKFTYSTYDTVFFNQEMEEKALSEMRKFEEKIKFDNLMKSETEISSELISNQMREKVHEIAQKFQAESSNGIKNIFADILSVGAFSWLLLVSKREIAILKDFIDRIIYGLSDSAKAFIIILSTDMFVGFHSPHGWEVIIGSILQHFGLPENHNFISLFIATIPVILDTIFKYWIFRYLNIISPSAVATYRNMNE
ncbi:proton extrusion protein PcxA [Scytonema sp. NUACC21]